MKTKENVIVTHEKAHIDELAGILAIHVMELKHHTPLSKIIFSSDKEELEKLIKKYPHGCFLGVARTFGSDFDEHTLNGKAVKAQSSIELVIDELGLSWNAYAGIFRYAHNSDNHACKNPMELYKIVVQLQQKQSDRDVYHWFKDLVLERTLVMNHFSSDYFKNLVQDVRQPSISKIDYDKRYRTRKTVNYTGRYDTIILPYDFSINHVVAVKILQNYGKKFGITYKTNIKFMKTNYRAKSNELAIGFNEGVFSEYPAEVAAQLCHISNKRFRKFELVMDYIRNLNLRDGYHPFELAHLMLTKKYDDYFNMTYKSLWKAYNFASRCIDLFVEKHLQFINTRKIVKSMEKGNDTFYRETINGLTLIGIDRHEYCGKNLTNYLFSPKGENADIVACKNKRGNICILLSGRANHVLNLGGLVAQIRVKEARLRNISMPKGMNLYSDGELEIIDQWYFQKDTGKIFNGSLTHNHVEPTRIAFKTIMNMVTKTMKMRK